MCSTVLDVAQFVINTVELETNAVAFGPNDTEGYVVMYSNIDALDAFFLQTYTDDIETEIS